MKIGELRSPRETLADFIRRWHGDSRPAYPILKDRTGKAY